MFIGVIYTPFDAGPSQLSPRQVPGMYYVTGQLGPDTWYLSVAGVWWRGMNGYTTHFRTEQQARQTLARFPFVQPRVVIEQETSLWLREHLGQYYVIARMNGRAYYLLQNLQWTRLGVGDFRWDDRYWDDQAQAEEALQQVSVPHYSQFMG